MVRRPNNRRMILAGIAIFVSFLFVVSASAISSGMANNLSSQKAGILSEQYSTGSLVTNSQSTFLSANELRTGNPSDVSIKSLISTMGTTSANASNSIRLVPVKVSNTRPSVPGGIYFTSVTYSLLADYKGVQVSSGSLAFKIEWENFGHGYEVIGGSATISSWTYKVDFRENTPFYSITASLTDSAGFLWKIPVTSSGSFSGTDSSFINPTTTISLKMTITLGPVPYDIFFDEYYVLIISGSTTIDLN